MDAAARRVHEVVDAPSAPAPAVEQLDLQEPKALADTVVRGTTLLRHRPCDAAFLALPDPAQPAAMTPARRTRPDARPP